MSSQLEENSLGFSGGALGECAGGSKVGWKKSLCHTRKIREIFNQGARGL